MAPPSSKLSPQYTVVWPSLMLTGASPMLNLANANTSRNSPDGPWAYRFEYPTGHTAAGRSIRGCSRSPGLSLSRLRVTAVVPAGRADAEAERLLPHDVELAQQVEAHERRAVVEVPVAVVEVRGFEDGLVLLRGALHDVDAQRVVPADRKVLVAGVRLERACRLRQRERRGDCCAQNSVPQCARARGPTCQPDTRHLEAPELE